MHSLVCWWITTSAKDLSALRAETTWVSTSGQSRSSSTMLSIAASWPAIFRRRICSARFSSGGWMCVCFGIGGIYSATRKGHAKCTLVEMGYGGMLHMMILALTDFSQALAQGAAMPGCLSPPRFCSARCTGWSQGIPRR